MFEKIDLTNNFNKQDVRLRICDANARFGCSENEVSIENDFVSGRVNGIFVANLKKHRK